MFTGIVEEIGTVESVRRGAASAVLEIRGKTVLEGTRTGDSIAVNGICLTVTHRRENRFSADVMHETLRRSSLARLGAGSHVNLERAMKADGRFGGHLVTGHVDGVGRIIRIWRDDRAVWYELLAEPPLLGGIVEKGSVTVDGISLTVASVIGRRISISAIPHTVNQTILKERRVGDAVNLETDIIGKYVARLMEVNYETV